MAIAGMPDFSHSANRSFSRAAPSSIEYSVCTCRWTKPGPDPPVPATPEAAAMKSTASFAGVGHASRRPRTVVHAWCAPRTVLHARARAGAFMSGAGGSDRRAVPTKLAAGARADPAHRAYRKPLTPQARHTGCTERPETLTLPRTP